MFHKIFAFKHSLEDYLHSKGVFRMPKMYIPRHSLRLHASNESIKKNKKIVLNDFINDIVYLKNVDFLRISKEKIKQIIENTIFNKFFPKMTTFLMLFLNVFYNAFFLFSIGFITKTWSWIIVQHISKTQ